MLQRNAYVDIFSTTSFTVTRWEIEIKLVYFRCNIKIQTIKVIKKIIYISFSPTITICDAIKIAVLIVVIVIKSQQILRYCGNRVKTFRTVKKFSAINTINFQ